MAAWLNRSTFGYAEAASDTRQRGNRSHVAPRGLSKPRYLAALANVSLEQLLLDAAAGPFLGDDAVHPIFCDDVFMSLTVDTSEAARASCTGTCALHEVIACLWLFEFIDEFVIEVSA